MAFGKATISNVSLKSHLSRFDESEGRRSGSLQGASFAFTRGGLRKAGKVRFQRRFEKSL